jgi:Arm DNA-binding domain
MDQHKGNGRLGGRERAGASSREAGAREAVCPGVTSIPQKTKHIYQIAFTYRGVECREKMALERTRSNDKYCERMRAEILGKIERGLFLYTE